MLNRSSPDASGEAPSEWISASERGSRAALRLAAACFRRFGDAPLRLLLAPIAGYYTLFAAEGRRASRAFLSRLDLAQGRSDRPRGWRDTYRHYYAFADAILDRFCFWTGAYDDFEIQLHGRDEMAKLIERGQGAVLVGAHLGSFDALRVIARDAGIAVNVLMFSAHAQRINETVRALDPESEIRVIDVSPTSVRSAFEVRRCIARGEFVAVLADRVQPAERSRIGRASFLGESAPFPQGPFLLAALLHVPVIMCLALKTGPRAYDIFLETLASGEAVPEQSREKAIQEWIEAFAARLEHHCVENPFQWFNFYDFWAGIDDGRR